MRRTGTFAAGLMALMLHAGAAAAGCAGTDAACTVPLGRYELELPAEAGEGVPALVFLHGHGSSGAGTMRNRGMVETALARGYAVIAPTGAPMQGRDGYRWPLGESGARDTAAFMAQVIDDAASAHGIDPDRVLLAGFSVGGSMVSYLACVDPKLAPAYAPVSGGFWRPHPEGCAGPVRLLHTHGWTDTTVPLEGRYRGGYGDGTNRRAQGDIFRTLEIWREANGCVEMRADSFVTEGPFWRRKWDRCTPGSALEFALFPGSHMIPVGWTEMALDWFEGLSLP